MEHLNGDTLARLVDERPEGNERRHLEECPDCQAELTALAEQTKALAELPDLLPPRGEWAALEARLEQEGLMERRADASRSATVRDIGSTRSASVPSSAFGVRWRGMAAGLALFIGGSAFGAAATSVGPGGDLASSVRGSEGESRAPTLVAQPATLDEAVEGVRLAEEHYVGALERYRQLLDGRGEASYDPVSRFAALDALVAASQAAVREAPTDPFLNGMLVSTVAERQATLRRISYDNWY